MHAFSQKCDNAVDGAGRAARMTTCAGVMHGGLIPTHRLLKSFFVQTSNTYRMPWRFAPTCDLGKGL